MVLVRVSLEAGREGLQGLDGACVCRRLVATAPVTRRHELDQAYTRRNRALSAHAR